MKTAFKILLLLILVLVSTLLWGALRLQPPVVRVEHDRTSFDIDAMAARLGAALAIPTISADDTPPELRRFDDLHALLREQFPRVHVELAPRTIGDGALLFRWPGREACPAALLAAHQDVVPVEPGTEELWAQAPFSGVIADGAVWGRGAIDDKAALLAILEASEQLLSEGFVPRCPVLFGFGHDEEVGGTNGAVEIARYLQQQGEQLAFVLDEGGAITTGTVPGVTLPLATIGVAEKGFLSLRLRSHDQGGHSSMPPRRTAIGRLAQAIARLEEQRPAAVLTPVQRELLERIAAYMPFTQKLALGNLWLTAPLVESRFAAVPATDATLRTTTAPTVFHAGIKDNVLAQQAEAVVNFRIRSGDSIDGVITRARAVVDDPEVVIEELPGFKNEPTAASSWDDPAYLRIERAIRSASPEPELIVAPYVTSGGTDARHYAALTDRLYRFLPVSMTPEMLSSFHGNNEHLPLAEYERMVRFYRVLLRDL